MSKRETKVYQTVIPVLYKNAAFLVKPSTSEFEKEKKKKRWTNSSICRPMCTTDTQMFTSQADPWPCFPSLCSIIWVFYFVTPVLQVVEVVVVSSASMKPTLPAANTRA